MRRMTIFRKFEFSTGRRLLGPGDTHPMPSRCVPCREWPHLEDWIGNPAAAAAEVKAACQPFLVARSPRTVGNSHPSMFSANAVALPTWISIWWKGQRSLPVDWQLQECDLVVPKAWKSVLEFGRVKTTSKDETFSFTWLSLAWLASISLSNHQDARRQDLPGNNGVPGDSLTCTLKAARED